MTFGLQNPDPYLQQALTVAAKQARRSRRRDCRRFWAEDSEAILRRQEGSSYTPVDIRPRADASTTPIQTGTVGVSATVTVGGIGQICLRSKRSLPIGDLSERAMSDTRKGNTGRRLLLVPGGRVPGDGRSGLGGVRLYGRARR